MFEALENSNFQTSYSKKVITDAVIKDVRSPHYFSKTFPDFESLSQRNDLRELQPVKCFALFGLQNLVFEALENSNFQTSYSKKVITDAVIKDVRSPHYFSKTFPDFESLSQRNDLRELQPVKCFALFGLQNLVFEALENSNFQTSYSKKVITDAVIKDVRSPHYFSKTFPDFENLCQ